MTGVAIATLFPSVVHLAAEGSLLPVLAGVAAILPDTLDFRITQYLERYDVEIDPGPEPNPLRIATQLADAMEHAYRTGEPQNVVLHNIRLSADRWRQYTVHVGHDCAGAAVSIGPLVGGDRVPVEGRERPYASSRAERAAGSLVARPTRPEEKEEAAQVKVDAPIARGSQATTTIDVFTGPSLKFERRGDELEIHFLDWHRRWSHSLTLAAVVAVGATTIAALSEWLSLGGTGALPLWAGLVTGLGFASHILIDQLGHLGCNLLFPFSRRRTRGLQMLHSGDAIPNFLTVWTATGVIILCLDQLSSPPNLSPAWFVGLAICLPVMVLSGLHQWQRSRHVSGRT